MKCNRFVWSTASTALFAFWVGCGSTPVVPTLDAGSECASDSDCDDGLFCTGAERCSPSTAGADARGCVFATTPVCGSGQTCDEATNTCTGTCDTPDADSDGHDSVVCGGDDCDDNAATVFPGAAEVCDVLGVDEDCDASTFGPRDIDADGYHDAACCNGSTCGDDCDDSRPGAHPSLTEVCNGLDDDCDGMVDEGATVMLWVDMDGDLYGDPLRRELACPDTVGHVNNDSDCDDTTPRRNPGAFEACDGVDNDCNSVVDDNTIAVTWYRDLDGDGYGDGAAGTVVSCEPVAGYAVLPGDCDDTRPDVNPAAAERCNGRDDNCDGAANFRIAVGDFEDDDGDGHGDLACPGGGGDDCDDRDPTSFGGTSPAAEICDFRDNNCDGTVDGATTMALWYVDADGDGYGDSNAAPIESCEPQSGRVYRGGDCDDANATIHPGRIDGCDGVDNDCDGDRDENAPRKAYYTDGDMDGFGAGTPQFACIAPTNTTLGAGDCADDDNTRHPGAAEDCNSVDDDCDLQTDEGAALTTFFQDSDRDGHGRAGGTTRMACVAPVGFAEDILDCDDGNPAIYPGAPELCNNVDDDCDLTVDGVSANAACVVANGTGVCRPGGVCDVGNCMAPFDDCDAVIANGCETDTRVDPLHCNGCGMACGAADTCSGSSCDDSPFVELSANLGTTSCVRRANGRLACWGDNRVGALGDGSTSPRVGAVTVVDIDNAVDVDAGPMGVCAVRSDGTVACWGYLDYVWGGASRPTLIPGIFDAVEVTVGLSSRCVRRSSGRVTCWGIGINGKLGNGSNLDSATPVAVIGITNAVQLTSGGGDNGSDGFHCARLATGRIMCWGYNVSGQLGDGTTGRPLTATPVEVLGIVNATDVDGGHTACTAVLSTGVGMAWGDATGTPASIPMAPTWTRIARAAYFSCGLGPAGSVYCFGSGGFGQLGLGDTMSRVNPTQIMGLTATEVAAGQQHACALTASNLVMCWGQNSSNELGDGGTMNRSSPGLVLGL